MEFFKATDWFSCLHFPKKLNRTPEQFYSLMELDCENQQSIHGIDPIKSGRVEANAEKKWWLNGRPYFNLWPAIADSLAEFPVGRVPLRSFFECPDPHISIQLEKGNPFGLSSILVSTEMDTEANCGLFCLESRQEYLPADMPRKRFRTVTRAVIFNKLDIDMTLDDLLDPSNPHYGKQELSTGQKIGLAVLLLENDPNVIDPDILRKDESKYELADDDERRRLREKAARRRGGQRGYHIGRKIEAAPHYRRPHPALVWTGKGRTIAKIIFRRGSIVHAKKLTEAPTGRLGSFGESDFDKRKATK